MTSTVSRPRVGISACLLGEPVRFDGGHKRDRWIVDEFSKWVDFVPVCPEAAMGLGTPRESMRLVRTTIRAPIRLLGVRSQKDFTEVAESWSARGVKTLPRDLDGYLLKANSPSCGLERVKVYGKGGIPVRDGMGIFARALDEAFPDLPKMEEGRLKDLEQREHFVTRVFAHFEWRKVPAKMAELQKFHRSYKFLLLAFHEPSLRRLGKILGNSEKKKPSEVKAAYGELFLKAIAHWPTRGQRINAIQHMLGFVKDRLSDREKAHASRLVEDYRAGQLPFVALLTLVGHVVETHDVEYVRGQKLLEPYPRGLRLVM